MTHDSVLTSVVIRDKPYDVAPEIDKAHHRRAVGIAKEKTRFGPRPPGEGTRSIRSIGSRTIFVSCTFSFARFLEVNRAGNLDHFPADAPEAYLYARSLHVGEAQLLADRWALQILVGRPLPRFSSSQPQELGPRAYTPERAAAIAQHQKPRNAFSTSLAAACGLRSMELFTIARCDEQPRDERPCPAFVHAYKVPGKLYTVKGKGGLVRSIHVPLSLVEQLEANRRPVPVRQRHQRRDLTSYYDIPAGQKWAASFSAACKRLIKGSAGSHGLRHAYVQDRIACLLAHDVTLADARAAVSVEIGHFRKEIIDVYLRGVWQPTSSE